MSDNKNTVAVQMTAEEKAQFEVFKQEQARIKAEEKLQQLRTSYDALREQFVNKTMRALKPLSEQIRKKKAEGLEEAAALQALSW